jgi:hypothetical protein
VSDLFDRQKQLQKEAAEIVERLGLEAMLAAIGRPIRVGSSPMGLMVQRDIDITVVCKSLDAGTLRAFSEIGARLMTMDKYVTGVRFRNDTGAWNADPVSYPDGLYLGLSVRAPDKAEWTFDIWAIDRPERQPDLAHLRTLLPRLTEAHREIILTIKHALADSQHAGEARVPSTLVYDAVVGEGIGDIGGFEKWLLTRQT